MLKTFRPRPAALAGAALPLLLCGTALLCTPGAPRAQGYSWKNVRIGGGGYVTGLVIHPLDAGTMYLRSDVAGVMRWDPATFQWASLTDKLVTSSRDSGYLNNCLSIAVDPRDTRILYAAVGGWGASRGLYKSTDKGDTWTGVDPGIMINGNIDGRWAGERLAVDPNNSGVVYYGSQDDGLWRSTNAGASWARVPTTVFPWEGGGDDWKRYGLMFVAADKNGGTVSVGGTTVSRYLYVGVYGGSVSPNYAVYPDGGVYRSADGGQSWQKLVGAPIDRPLRGAVASDGTFWVTGNGGVFKFARGATSPVNVTPASDPGQYCGLSIAPNDPQHVVVARNAGYGGLPVLRTLNGGGSWTNVKPRPENTTLDTNAVPLAPSAATTSVAIDPGYTKRVWIGDWYQPYKTDDADASPVLWRGMNRGYESIVALELSCPPGPAGQATLFSGTADVGGFRHTDLTATPAKLSGNFDNGTSVDFCEADPNVVVQVGGNGWYGATRGAVSNNNGASWSAIPINPNDSTHKAGLVAVGATKQANGWPVIVQISNKQAPRRSLDGGQTWQAVSGITSSDTAGHLYDGFFDVDDPLTSDRVNGNKFYIYKQDGLGAPGGGKGTLYRSTNGGANWSPVYTLNYAGGGTEFKDIWLKASPGVEGEMWLGLGSEGAASDAAAGLYRINSGASATTVSKVAAVQEVVKLGLGRPAPGRSNPALYVIGRVNNDFGIWRSEDAGANWTKVYDQEDARQGVLTFANAIEGDRNVFGRVYVATGGRGIWVGEPGAAQGGAALSRTSWSASASHTWTAEWASRAIDNNSSTRYSSGTSPAAGMWFQVDMGAARTFNKIVLDSGGSAGDYTRGYQVYATNDPSSLGSPVATGTGTGAVVTVTFPTQTKRYIRVVNTSNVSGAWWSIHEFNAYAP